MGASEVRAETPCLAFRRRTRASETRRSRLLPRAETQVAVSARSTAGKVSSEDTSWARPRVASIYRGLQQAETEVSLPLQSAETVEPDLLKAWKGSESPVAMFESWELLLAEAAAADHRAVRAEMPRLSMPCPDPPADFSPSSSGRRAVRGAGSQAPPQVQAAMAEKPGVPWTSR